MQRSVDRITDITCFASIIRGREVFICAAVLAAISMALVPPDEGYSEYIDWRTLCILFCFMACIAGLRSTGAFESLAYALAGRMGGVRGLCATLVLLPTVLSMFITNDVSLLTFVPFAIAVLDSVERRDLIVPVLILQTLGANIGCAVLPFGSPQNIFIDSVFSPSISDFIATTLPFAIVGVAVLALLILSLRNSPVSPPDAPVIHLDHGRIAVFSILFIVCVLIVLRIVPPIAALILTVAVLLAVSPCSFRKIDYALIATFVLLFVFAGNISRLDYIHSLFEGLMSWDPALGCASVSQVISNVPAVVMLSGYTDDWQALLIGSNIGGFGTPIASMASVITLRLYTAERDSNAGCFILISTAANILLLSVFVLLYAVMFV